MLPSDNFFEIQHAKPKFHCDYEYVKINRGFQAIFKDKLGLMNPSF